MSPIVGSLAGISAQAYGLFAPPLVTGNYYSIQTVTLTTGSSTISFSSIPSTYTHLQVRSIVRSSSSNGTDGVGLYMQLNSDTGNNYSYHKLLGNGSTASASGSSTTNYSEFTTSSAAGVTANVFAGFVVDILDYANANKYKTLRSLGGYDAKGSGYIHFGSVLWQSASAISSFVIKDGIGTGFAANSTFALYGVK